MSFPLSRNATVLPTHVIINRYEEKNPVCSRGLLNCRCDEIHMYCLSLAVQKLEQLDPIYRISEQPNPHKNKGKREYYAAFAPQAKASVKRRLDFTPPNESLKNDYIEIVDTIQNLKDANQVYCRVKEMQVPHQECNCEEVEKYNLLRSGMKEKISSLKSSHNRYRQEATNWEKQMKDLGNEPIPICKKK